MLWVSYPRTFFIVFRMIHDTAHTLRLLTIVKNRVRRCSTHGEQEKTRNRQMMLSHGFGAASLFSLSLSLSLSLSHSLTLTLRLSACTDAYGNTVLLDDGNEYVTVANGTFSKQRKKSHRNANHASRCGPLSRILPKRLSCNNAWLDCSTELFSILTIWMLLYSSDLAQIVRMLLITPPVYLQMAPEE